MPETRHYCPHREEKVSLSTLHRHKQLYYKENSRAWVKKSEVLSDSEGEDVIGSLQLISTNYYSSDGNYSDASDEGRSQHSN